MSRLYRTITQREIDELRMELLGYAKEYGLNPFPTIFEVVNYDEMNEITAYTGFPGRFPHWRFGMDYEINKKSQRWGLHKIYELVINNNPCYAYLLKSNTMIEQKIVIAHVYGHSDFFRNNLWFSNSNRKMLDEIANHSTKIQTYIDKHGHNKVEDWIDVCMSLENLIDYHSVFKPRTRKELTTFGLHGEGERRVPYRPKGVKKYIDNFLSHYKTEKKEDEEKVEMKHFPEKPQKDVMLFLREHAQLKPWESDILSIIREEAYYFAPQAMTKIMNEGWAAYWHARILTDKCLKDDEVVDFSDINAGVLGGSVAMNPYKLGFELYRDIEERWNKGKFGVEYELCDDMKLKKAWDLKLGKGRDKIFEVRKIYNDVTFIDEFMNAEFCDKNNLFVYKKLRGKDDAEIVTRDYNAVKKVLLFKLTNMGHPIIEVVDGNYENRGELLLKHRHDGDEFADLQLDEARDVLKNVFRVWKRPVNLDTKYKQKDLVIRFDGENIEETK